MRPFCSNASHAVTDLGPSLRPPYFPPNLVPPKRTILSPTIQQHWRRRGHGPFPFGSIFFQVKDTEEKFIWRFNTFPVRIPSPPPTLTLLELFFFPPPSIAPCFPPKSSALYQG